MDLRVGVSAVVMNWLIMLYFIILFAERVQSIVRSIRDKDVKLFGSGFDSYVYLAVFLSLAAFLVLLAVGNAAFLQSLFTMDMNVYRSIDYRLWMSLIYLILFSMAIPVMYHSEIEKAILFHVIEAVVSLALVAAFAVLMYKVLIGNAVNLFYVIPIAIAVIGDTIIVAMRWKEKVNGFVLIFLIAASVMWIAGRIAAAVRLHG